MKKEDNPYFNHEGYYDPTAGRAIINIDRKRKVKHKSGKARLKEKRRRKCNGA